MRADALHGDGAVAFLASWSFWARCAVITSVFAFCYARVFSNLVEAWWTNSVHSHGFLVPFISLYLVWIRRDSLSRLAPAPMYSGLFPLMAGLSMLVVASAAGVSFVQELSIIVTLAGVVLLVLGGAFLSLLLFPILYLAFMMRFWEIFTSSLHLPFQTLSAWIGASVLKAAGIPAFLHSSVYIELPDLVLEVAEVCSGVNYLIAVLALGIPLAYVALDGWKRRALLVLGALMIAALANGMRVALIGALVFYGLSGDIHGPGHVLQAMFVSVIGFAVLFAGAVFLSRYNKGRERSGTAPASAPEAKKRSSAFVPVIIAAVSLLGAGLIANFRTPEPVSLEQDLSSFPNRIGGWDGRDSSPESWLKEAVGADQELSRTYSMDGRELRLYIGYMSIQTQGKEVVNYRTAEFHRGVDALKIPLGPGASIEVNMAVRKSGAGQEAFLFWYDANGRSTAGRLAAKGYTVLDYLARDRNNGAIIVISSSLAEDGLDRALGAEMDFVKALMPELKRYLPA